VDTVLKLLILPASSGAVLKMNSTSQYDVSAHPVDWKKYVYRTQYSHIESNNSLYF